MKRLLVIVMLFFGTITAFSQSALYEHYKNRAGLQVSTIKNYDIGGQTKVTVTMLEAADTATYNELKKEFKRMKPLNTKEHEGRADGLPFNVGKISSLKMDVTVKDKTSDTVTALSPYRKVDIQSAAPLRGDKGEYLICGSNKTLTILVFHCPNHNVYRRAMKFVLLHSIEK